MSEPPLRERRDGPVLRLTLDDPRHANAFSPPLVAALTATYGRDLRREGVRAIVLDAAGPHFSAGADLGHLQRLREAGADENRADSERLRALFGAVLHQEALTVALVHGACIAGGCGLATAHDVVVAAEGARFLYSEARIGFVPALVAAFLPQRLRGSDLRQLLLRPEPLDAARACELGLVDRVVAAEELEGAGTEIVARALAETSSESIARTKRLLLELLGRPLDEALELAAAANAEARSTADCRFGIDTFLATKKTPDWSSR